MYTQTHQHFIVPMSKLLYLEAISHTLEYTPVCHLLQVPGVHCVFLTCFDSL